VRNLQSLKIRNQTQKNAKEIINEFSDFLTIPNVAANPKSLRENANFTMGMMTRKGIKTL
jgi:hypothetical protein